MISATFLPPTGPPSHIPVNRMLKDSSRRPARIFGPSSALRNLAVALLWLRFRALNSFRISAPGSVRSIPATCKVPSAAYWEGSTQEIRVAPCKQFTTGRGRSG
jgi:hypothetical protein